jgi:hypothetical protein
MACHGRQQKPGAGVIMIFKIFSPKKMQQSWCFFAENAAKLCKKLIITLFFLIKRYFFGRKSSKIAEIGDRNIDPSCRLTSYVHIIV